MKPVFKINNKDFTKWVADGGLKPTRNDLDADNSGRNLLSGLMHRKRITDKEKWSVEFSRMPASVLSEIEEEIYGSGNYYKATFVNTRKNKIMTKTFYTSTINEGAQLYRDGGIVYEGVNFNLTER